MVYIKAPVKIFIILFCYIGSSWCQNSGMIFLQNNEMRRVGVGQHVLCDATSQSVLSYSFDSEYVCIKDPYQNICAQEDQRQDRRDQQKIDVEKERIKKIISQRQQSKENQARLQILLQACNDKKDANTKQICLNITKRDFNSKIANEVILSEIGSEGRDQVKNYSDDFIQYIQQSYGALLPPQQLKLITGYLTTCSQNIEVEDSEGLNATASFGIDNKKLYQKVADLGRRYGRDQKINPLQEMLTNSAACKVSLNLETLISCKYGYPMCAQLMMHEMSHFLNSCIFKDQALWLREYNNRINSGELDYDKRYKENTQTVINNLITQVDSIDRNLFQAQRSCLESMPNPPRTAQVNSCNDTNPFTSLPKYDEYLRYCGRDSDDYANGDDEVANGYPSNWREAEADMVAASALAFHMQKRFPHSVSRRRDYTFTLLKQWCQLSDVSSMYSFTGHSHANAFRSVTHSTSEREKLVNRKCMSRPKNANGAQPWFTTHPDNIVRINEYLLLNSDMRRSLNCQQLVPGVPSCNERNQRVVPIVTN